MSTAKSIICFFFEYNLPKPNHHHQHHYVDAVAHVLVIIFTCTLDHRLNRLDDCCRF